MWVIVFVLFVSSDVVVFLWNVSVLLWVNVVWKDFVVSLIRCSVRVRRCGVFFCFVMLFGICVVWFRLRLVWVNWVKFLCSCLYGVGGRLGGIRMFLGCSCSCW